MLTECSSPTLSQAFLRNFSFSPGHSCFISVRMFSTLAFAAASRVSRVNQISEGLDKSTTMASVVCLKVWNTRRWYGVEYFWSKYYTNTLKIDKLAQ